MRQILGIMLAASAVSGCASAQLNENTVEISATVQDVYTRQTLNNISKFVDDKHAFPSQMMLSAGVFQTGNSITPSVSFPFTDTIGRTLTAAASSSAVNSRSTAGAGAILSGTNSTTQNYTVAPVSDSIVLRNQQALYQYAVYGDNLLGRYLPQRVFVKDTFYIDPFYLQLPQCVICARKQGVFTKNIAVYGAVPTNLQVNPKLLRNWIYIEGGLNPGTGKVTQEDLVSLGHYGQHDLFIKKSDYDKGVLSDFVLATLNFTQPVESFATNDPQIVTAGPKPEAGSSEKADRGGPGRGKAFIEQRIVGPRTISPPATNQQLAPQSPFNIIVPQMIIPSQ